MKNYENHMIRTQRNQNVLAIENQRGFDPSGQ
jgi:hypothetical protein